MKQTERAAALVCIIPCSVVCKWGLLSSSCNAHAPPVAQVNKLSAALEDLSDEAAVLRRKAGLPADQPLDTAGVKLQKDITIAQLRSVNALLERQVRDLLGGDCEGPSQQCLLWCSLC